MRLEKKILKGLGEYFFGLETKKELDYQKAFYIESITCKDGLGRFLCQLNEVEKKYITFSKYLPLFVEQTGFIASLITKRYDLAIGGLISGNLLRIALLPFNPAKDGREILKDNIKTLNNGKSLEENALEMLEHWGHRTEIEDYKDLEEED